jgi:tetratricopeptide (TPR) repeat protein
MRTPFGNGLFMNLLRIPLRLLELLAALVLGTAAATAHGPFHEQIQALTLELQSKPEDLSLLARRCDIERAHGLWPEAMADLVQLEKLAPADPTNGLRRGVILLGQGHAVEAVPYLRKWVGKHPDGTDERLALAQACMGAKHWTHATQEFSTVLASSAEARAQVFLDRAQCQQQAGDSATNILKGLDEGIVRIGPTPQLVRHAAEVELLRGAVEAAVARFGVLAERSERKERWLFEQGELFRRGGRWEDAQRCYSNAIVALESLPPKFQRSLLSVELRRELEARLGSGGVR